MIGPFSFVHLIFGIAQFLAGIMANGIIIIVSGLEYIKKKKVTAYDLLLTSLGICRIFLQVLILVSNVKLFLIIELCMGQGVFIFFFFVNEINLWLSTFLCVFYCVKIANIVHPFFFWLKMRISRFVPWWILASLLISSAISVCHNLLYWPEAKKELRKILAGNSTTQDLFQYMLPTQILVVGLAMPSCMFSVASFMLIYSLCRHTRWMRNMATGSRDPSTEAHICAMKLIFSFLVLYTSYYVGVLVTFSKFPIGSEFLQFLLFSVAALFPSGHSIILILGNSKLKHYTRKFLLSAKWCQGGGSALDST
ncbi:taste receptor type 2 member 1-like [Phascolarctos cinereus]|uniref:Taste receptor type 2 n=1 Tax=Phascolarctos cinereus TaxID=38626 RepID=A0A6P5LSF5_PHACI|nr:taste receptor type 2 member 1-like [Phascolarctos cinereus]